MLLENHYQSRLSLYLRRMLLLCAVLLCGVPLMAQTQPQEEGICARVRIKISQEVAITRTAFRATLEITNSAQNVPLQNVNVMISIKKQDSSPANDLFAISIPQLNGISDVSGNGTIGQGGTAQAIWTIIPKRDAALDGPVQYSVGGKLSYIQDGEVVNAPLFPATITVKPDPLLVLDYFLVRDVYSDDPFTLSHEPAEPFPLGLLLSNLGKGIAKNVQITSSQPQIVDNEKGLLVDFKIIGTQVNTDPVSPSLAVNLGDIEPSKTACAKWMMTSSLAGKFIEYKATFEHSDELGGVRLSPVDSLDPQLSLIDSVNIHELTHAVRIDTPDDDLKPDFLANDNLDENSNPQHLPNALYSSDGTRSPVSQALFPSVDGPIVPDRLQAELKANVPGGWVYIRANDPGQDKYRLKKVVRSDGRDIRVDDNAWTTHRTIRLKGQTPYREHIVHILDKDSTGTYMLFYEVASSSGIAMGDLKKLADDCDVSIGGATGTAVTALLPDCMYVESLDRSGGIKVVGMSAFEGERVTVTGRLSTDANGERFINASAVNKVGAGALQPLGMSVRSLWGGDFTAIAADSVGQQGTSNGAGLNVVGQFVRAVGRVVSTGTGSFTLEDGSGRSVKVLLSADASSPAEKRYVRVTGVVSLEIISGDVIPVIRIRRADDIFAYNIGPSITGVKVTNITTTSADISWSTDVVASAKVLYGTTNGTYTDTMSGPDFVQGHVVNLTGLKPGTTYYFVAQSQDYYGSRLITTSLEYSFTTSGATAPSLTLTFPSAARAGAVVTANAQLANTGGDAENVRITAIAVSPASASILTSAPLLFGETGAVNAGQSVIQPLTFSTSDSTFYVKLTVSYTDKSGVARVYTTPWKIAVIH